MDVPVYIKQALARRARAANMFMKYDLIISKWCSKNDIDTEPYDTYGGVESIVHPYESQQRILNAIKNK